MTGEMVPEIWCDYCVEACIGTDRDDRALGNVFSLQELREVAVKRGWTCDGQDYCPDCSTTKATT